MFRFVSSPVLGFFKYSMWFLSLRFALSHILWHEKEEKPGSLGYMRLASTLGTFSISCVSSDGANKMAPFLWFQ